MRTIAVIALVAGWLAAIGVAAQTASDKHAVETLLNKASELDIFLGTNGTTKPEHCG